MEKTVVKRNRLNNEQRLLVLALLARGDTAAEVNEELDRRYGFTVSDMTVSAIRKANAETLAVMQSQLMQHQTDDVNQMLSEARKQISSKLIRARKDELKLDEINRQYREGEITKSEYDRMRSGYLTLSLKELTTLSKEMYDQVTSHGKGKEGEAGKVAPADFKALDMVANALRSGNTVELQRIVFSNANAE